MKAELLAVVRSGHLLFAPEKLPDRLAIYFHELEGDQVDGFVELVRYFTARGYRCVDAETYAAPGDDRRLFLSFDDNFKSWHDNLDAITDCGATCTFYINSGVFREQAPDGLIRDYFDRIAHQGDRRTLTVSELRAIAACGHRIGCHTHTHPILSQTDKGLWEREIRHSKRVLEDMTGRAVTDFSFPYGMRRHFSETLRAYCQKAGFRTIATGLSGQLNAPHVDPFDLHRTGWKFDRTFSVNLDNLRLDSRIYARLSGRSAAG
ncbi:MAG: polysaccharide deacetylase family protein [Pseudomonadota bacterium]